MMRPVLAPNDDITPDHDLAVLMAGVARGDADALAAFYDATSARVYSLVLRIVGDAVLAEEVLLDVFTAVWRQAAAHQQRPCPPLLWVLMIARSLALDKRPGRPEAVVAQQGKAESSAGCADFAEDASAVAPQDAVPAALNTLPPEQQVVTELAYYSGANYAEIAEILALPPETVKGRIYLAMLRLREAYAQRRAASAKMQQNDKAGGLPSSAGA
jgi:RNA polymerase sigma-70 factor, ECF subfamily